MARCRALNSSFIGTSVKRPPAVAHGGNFRPGHLDARCTAGSNGWEDRQQSQRCTVGSACKKLNDVLSVKHKRCTVGSHLGMRAQAEARRPVTDRSVIFVFQHGGPSQFETFDPKMTAPEGIRSTTGEINTTLPDITFGSTFTQLAKLAYKLAVVRSYVPGDANHDAKPIVHRE